MLHHAARGELDVFGIVATSEADILGCVTAMIEEQASPSGHGKEGPGSTCYLLTLVVRADQRSSGIGRGLLLALRQEVSKRGVSKIATDVASPNLPAIRFFDVSGFSRAGGPIREGSMVEFHLDI